MFLVCHTPKDISLSIHLACFVFRLFCCESIFRDTLWDIWCGICGEIYVVLEVITLWSSCAYQK